MNPERIQKLRACLKKGRLFYASTPGDVFYLSGFSGTFGKIAVSPAKAVFITDNRYADGLRQTKIPSHFEIVTVKKFQSSLKQVLAGSREILISKNTALPEYLMLDKLKKKVSISTAVEKMRMIKDENEIKNIENALKINEKAILHIAKILKPGVSECELSAEFECFIRKQGAQSASFSPIIAFNENSAVPHHAPSGKKLTHNSLVLIDCGVKLNGYCSDLTRVIAFGIMKTRLKNIRKNYEAVLKAKKAGSAAFKAGTLCRKSDAAARAELKRHGLDRLFTHSLGHSLGIDVHEPPYAAAREKERFRAGMVLTCEPGIYLKDQYGIRIEDDYLVTEVGSRKLSTLSDSLIIL